MSGMNRQQVFKDIMDKWFGGNANSKNPFSKASFMTPPSLNLSSDVAEIGGMQFPRNSRVANRIASNRDKHLGLIRQKRLIDILKGIA